ncbi:hypothetical protein CDAR_12151 [Caerostris darwini]|uniref:Uncharacterized protein n=1 Tax=Caerostris darwini TaxID=1538125 RepID=A0AAV4WYM8_9ARAC|nr:hypothetical protein CDAR_12151 [Caerostris darwini]
MINLILGHHVLHGHTKQLLHQNVQLIQNEAIKKLYGRSIYLVSLSCLLELTWSINSPDETLTAHPPFRSIDLGGWRAAIGSEDDCQHAIVTSVSWAGWVINIERKNASGDQGGSNSSRKAALPNVGVTPWKEEKAELIIIT